MAMTSSMMHIGVGRRGEIVGDLHLPDDPHGLVVFAHGSGSSRHSPRNRLVARVLDEAELGTLLIDLLTAEEEAVDVRTAELRFDIGLLAERLLAATEAADADQRLRDLRLGYFGASTGAAAAWSQPPSGRGACARSCLAVGGPISPVTPCPS